jgi:mono/diheme cytochrome c family protein
VFALLVWAGLAGLSQEKKEAQKEPAEFKIPPEEAKRQNPVKPTPASLAQGKRIYAFDCAMCHGKDGDGKGELADTMGLKLSDFRDPAALKDLTDGELFYIVSKGKGKMPSNEDRTKAEQRWDLINFIRSLGKKAPAPGPKQ